MQEYDKALTEPAHAVFRILDANSDNQLTYEELDRAARVLADQFRRLQLPEAPNSFWHPIQTWTTSVGGTTTVLPVSPAPAATTPVRP
jgi:hypothetical protein